MPRSNHRSLRTVGLAALAIVAVFAVSPRADATNSLLSNWKSTYPASLSDDNASASGSACVLCHASGSFQFNAYGWRIRQNLNAGQSNTQAILNAESMNSDGDPTGSSNLVEIMADAQPGWTPGPNNVIHSSNGNTSQSSPPAGLVNLDPSLCGNAAKAANYGSGKAGTNGVPTLVSNNPPVLGGMTDLTIGNGLGGATAFLFFGLSQANLPFDAGALLVNPLAGPIMLPLNGAGAISVPVNLPANAALCGFPVYFQAMFQDPGAGGFLHTAQTPGLAWTLGS